MLVFLDDVSEEIMKARVLWVLSLASAFAVGCAHEETARVGAPVHTTGMTTYQPKTMPTPKTTTPKSTGNLTVSSEIAAACGIQFNDINSAPKFDFDQSALEPQDEEVLTQIARCVTTGPLKGHSLELVGRADPRGEEEYNFALGEHRADSVKSFLTQMGVDTQKIGESSRGELDATGTDEQGWEKDRRVDITLKH